MWKKIVTFFKWAATYESNDNSKEKKEDDAAIIRRARDKKGQYQGDDESTPDVIEAWEGGKAPKKQVHRSKYKKNL